MKEPCFTDAPNRLFMKGVRLSVFPIFNYFCFYCLTCWLKTRILETGYADISIYERQMETIFINIVTLEDSMSRSSFCEIKLGQEC